MKTNAKSEIEIEAQARMLCTRIDSEIRKPAVVLVTSAERGDGASYTARMLASAFGKFGRRTALFDATNDVRDVHPTPFKAMPEPGAEEPTIVRMRTFDRSSSREALSEFVASLRASYDITIIDTEPVMEGNGAMALGDVADATLVTVRLGRVAGPGDEIAAMMLEGCKAQFLGVVTTDGEELERFEEERHVELMPNDFERALPSRTIHSNVVKHEPVAGLLVTVLFVAACGAYRAFTA